MKITLLSNAKINGRDCKAVATLTKSPYLVNAKQQPDFEFNKMSNFALILSEVPQDVEFNKYSMEVEFGDGETKVQTKAELVENRMANSQLLVKYKAGEAKYFQQDDLNEGGGEIDPDIPNQYKGWGECETATVNFGVTGINFNEGNSEIPLDSPYQTYATVTNTSYNVGGSDVMVSMLSNCPLPYGGKMTWFAVNKLMENGANGLVIAHNQSGVFDYVKFTRGNGYECGWLIDLKYSTQNPFTFYVLMGDTDFDSIHDQVLASLESILPFDWEQAFNSGALVFSGDGETANKIINMITDGKVDPEEPPVSDKTPYATLTCEWRDLSNNYYAPAYSDWMSSYYNGESVNDTTTRPQGTTWYDLTYASNGAQDAENKKVETTIYDNVYHSVEEGGSGAESYFGIPLHSIAVPNYGRFDCRHLTFKVIGGGKEVHLDVNQFIQDLNSRLAQAAEQGQIANYATLTEIEFVNVDTDMNNIVLHGIEELRLAVNAGLLIPQIRDTWASYVIEGQFANNNIYYEKLVYTEEGVLDHIEGVGEKPTRNIREELAGTDEDTYDWDNMVTKNVYVVGENASEDLVGTHVANINGHDIEYTGTKSDITVGNSSTAKVSAIRINLPLPNGGTLVKPVADWLVGSMNINGFVVYSSLKMEYGILDQWIENGKYNVNNRFSFFLTGTSGIEDNSEVFGGVTAREFFNVGIETDTIIINTYDGTTNTLVNNLLGSNKVAYIYSNTSGAQFLFGTDEMLSEEQLKIANGISFNTSGYTLKLYADTYNNSNYMSHGMYHQSYVSTPNQYFRWHITREYIDTLYDFCGDKKMRKICITSISSSNVVDPNVFEGISQYYSEDNKLHIYHMSGRFESNTPYYTLEPLANKAVLHISSSMLNNYPNKEWILANLEVVHDV